MRRGAATAVVLAATLPLMVAAASGGHGSLDPSFGNHGKVAATGSGLAALAIQPDGKIVAGGYGSEPLVRFNRDGSPDRAFGSYGGVNWPKGEVRALVLQADGKIVTAGDGARHAYFTHFALHRFLRDGRLDRTFGIAGTAAVRNGEVDALVLQPDGKIVAAGKTNKGFMLVRFDSDGRLDLGFGDAGVVVGVPPGESALSALAIQRDGKLVAAGGVPSQSAAFRLARYLPNGALDRTFGTNGVVTTAVAGDMGEGAAALAIQADGKIVAAGTGKMAGQSAFELVRYEFDGSLDRTFGTNGRVTTTSGNGGRFGFANFANALAIGRRGTLLVGGSSRGSSGHSRFALARYDADGLLDPTFGNNGTVTTSFSSGDSEINALAIRRDGRIVAAGWADLGSALARYLP